MISKPSKSLYKYCQLCGALMDMTIKEIPQGFDRDTGVQNPPLAIHYWRCPKEKFWNGHDKFDDGPKPEEFFFD